MQINQDSNHASILLTIFRSGNVFSQVCECRTDFFPWSESSINYEFKFINEDGSSEKFINYLNSEAMHILLEKIDKDLDDDFIEIETTVQILRENL